MKKIALLASAALITAGSISTAEAQRGYRDGWRGGHHGHYYRGSRWGNGGALAAGLIGGALLGGLVTAAATPAYAYPSYNYGYAPAYGYGYAPAYSYGYGYPYGGYYAAPVATRVVYQPAPVYRRVVYRPAPVYRTRVVYQQPRVRTRVVYRQNRPARVVRTVRRDVVTTGSIRRSPYEVRVRYR